MENVLLTLKEASDLESKSYETIKKRVQRNSLNTIKVEALSRCGFEYRIPLSELSEQAQQRYIAAQRQKSEAPDLDQVVGRKAKEPVGLDYLTADQRSDAWWWEEVIKKWQASLPSGKGKTEATEAFVNRWNAEHDRRISVRTLYEKNKAYREYGTAGLADGRMSRDKKGRKMDEKLWSIFLQWYLDENKPAVSYLYTVLQRYVKMEGWEVKVPSEATFRRMAQELPPPVIKYFREGSKVFEDECLPYVGRLYDNFVSNEFWSSDYHTLDLMVRDDITGEVYRPHLVVWTDVKSRKILTLRLRRSSDSDGVQLSFREAARIYGLPNYVYLDNGREFLVHDFGGRGRRKTDQGAQYGSSLLDRLGIRMVNAIVRNGKAKVVERTFKQVTSEFAKLFITYCGNRPGNRPERHARIMKDPANIPLASEVLSDLQAYVEGWYNQKPSQAKGLNGMSPNEAYAMNLIKKRAITEDQANLLLLRTTKMQTMCREGVYVVIGSRKVWFFAAEIVSAHMGEKVYVRYDPDDMTSVRVYDEHEKFMAVMDRKLEGGYDMEQDTEAIKRNNAAKRHIKQTVRNLVEEQRQIMEAPELRDVVIQIARDNIEKDEQVYEAAVIQMHQSHEREERLQEAVGGGVLVDLHKMRKNALKRKGEDQHV